MRNYRLVSARIAVLVITSFFCGGCSHIDYNNPARRPDNEIKAEILAATPLGTEFGRVQEYVAKRWGEPATEFHEPRSATEEKKGVSKQYGRPYYDFPPHDVLELLVPAEVSVEWFFDEDDRLDEVRVTKYRAGP
jgi:hypothetical protein